MESIRLTLVMVTKKNPYPETLIVALSVSMRLCSVLVHEVKEIEERNIGVWVKSKKE